MATLVLVTDADDGGRVVARRARLRERMAARWRAGALERELARGAAPETTAALALRAQALIGPRTRAALARRVHVLVRDAGLPPRVGRTKITPRLGEIAAAARDLDRLAARLAGPGPVNARGVAEVRLLLTDGCGPLYFRGSGVDLGAAISRALDDLEVPAQGSS